MASEGLLSSEHSTQSPHTAAVQVGRESGKVGHQFSVALSGLNKGSNDTLHLWSPDSPYLYDLEVTLRLPGNSQVSSFCISLNATSLPAHLFVFHLRPTGQFTPCHTHSII